MVRTHTVLRHGCTPSFLHRERLSYFIYPDLLFSAPPRAIHLTMKFVLPFAPSPRTSEHDPPRIKLSQTQMILYLKKWTSLNKSISGSERRRIADKELYVWKSSFSSFTLSVVSSTHVKGITTDLKERVKSPWCLRFTSGRLHDICLRSLPCGETEPSCLHTLITVTEPPRIPDWSVCSGCASWITATCWVSTATNAQTDRHEWSAHFVVCRSLCL